MSLGTASIIRANARDLPLADNTVDLVVTSPPYFALRSYQDGGEHYSGQIGSEPTPAEFVDALLEVTRECVRVLKPSGSLWVNLGDKYSGGNNTRRGTHGGAASEVRGGPVPLNGRVAGLPQKSLIGIPWRYALACIDDLGLILRAEVIWSKPNGLPESVTDRVRRSHEQWFHFTLQPRYFAAVDEIREEHAESGLARRAYAFNVNDAQRASKNPVLNGAGERPANPLGKLPGSVWTVPTQPLRVPEHLGVDHFAAFPMEWPRRIIQGWSPSGVCTVCGEGRRPVVAKSLDVNHVQRNAYRPGSLDGHARWAVDVGADRVVGNTSATITGYSCACPEPTAPTTPATILDPFGGTGTVALVAKMLGRNGISVDMSSDYCRLAEWRTNDPAEMARVLGQRKPEPVSEGQLELWA